MASMPRLARRAGGVLLHPTSLPGPGRAGSLGPEASRFLQFLADAGQSWWQTLPLQPPDASGSPYASPSAFAGSPGLVSLEALAGEGWLSPGEALGEPERALSSAAAAFERRASPAERGAFEAFREREASWLGDFALFCALREARGGRPWTEWEAELSRRDPAALERARGALRPRILRHELVQWFFARQWESLRARARPLGVGLLGDLPLFVSLDSADAWARPELFLMDGSGRPSAVAGVPPDYFSAEGQLWGNPLYDWDAHRAGGFAWWLERLRVCAERFDAVRLDHFNGLARCWAVPAGAATAAEGSWVPVPGEELLAAARRDLPGLELLAEDLGEPSEAAQALRRRFGLPGMRVAQFSFGGEEALPSRWPRECVGYTGTHDNDTARGWWESAGAAERAAFERELGRPADRPGREAAELVWRSPAAVAMAPLQDLLDLPSAARMNRPGALSESNWRWRAEAGAADAALAGWLGGLTAAAGRAPSGGAA